MSAVLPIPAARPPAPPDDAPGPGWIVRLGYVLAAVLLAGTVVASVNPEFGFFNAEATGFDARRWPWQALERADGRLVWRRETAWIVALSASALALLAAASLAPRARAILGLGAAVVVGVALLPPEQGDLVFPGMSAAIALLLAAGVAMNRSPGSPDGRRLVGVAAILLGGLLFLPLPPPDPDLTGPNEIAGYRSFAVDAVYAARDLASSAEESGKPLHGSHVLLLLPLIAWPLGLGVALLMLVGLGRPWAPWALGALLFTLILAHPLALALELVADGRLRLQPGETLATADVLARAARGASESMVLAERLMLLPLALGLVDLFRPRTRRA